MSRITLLIIAATALTTGCVVRGTAGYNATYEASGPDLVEVSPGVQVIADYDEPIFYSDNYYWRNDGGRWYRSSYYNRGWVYASPPSAVISIRDPYRYRRYRPAGYVRRDHRQPAYRQPARDNRQPYRAQPYRDNRQPYRAQPVVRDHRPAPARDARPAPVVRDHRPAERREERRESRPARGPVIRDHR